MEGGGGEGGERKILRLGMWPSKALESPWKRPNEGLYQYGFLKGRKAKELGSEGELSLMGAEDYLRVGI